MDNRTKTIGAILLILILAVAAVGYAINYYAEHKGGEVDPDYLVITDLDTSEVEFNTVEHNVEGYGKIATSTPKEGTKLVYSVDDSKVEGAYYLTLVSYVLYLDDGTVITGTVDGTGNNISVNYDKSTVVTRTDLKLYLDSFTPDSEKKISFSLDGAMISNSEFPVYGDKTAPATGAGLKTIDVKLGVTKYDQEHTPQISLTINSSNATGVEYLTVGSTGSLVYDLKIDGALNYGYTVEWAFAPTSLTTDIVKIDAFGNVTGLTASTDYAEVTAEFDGVSASENVKVCVGDVQITGANIHGQKMRIAIGGSQAITIAAVHPATDTSISYTDIKVVSDNVNFTYAADKISVAQAAADRETATFTVSFQDAIGATYVGFFFVETFDARIDIVGPSSVIGNGKFALGTVQEIDVAKSVYGHEIKWTAGTADKVLFSVDKIRWASTITTDEPIVYFKGINDGDSVVISADYATPIDQTTVTTKDTITIQIVTPTLVMKYTDNGAVPSTTSELDENKHYLMPEYGSDEIFATLTNVPNGAIIMWSSDNSSVFEVEATGVKEEPSEVNAYCTISALRFDAAVAQNNIAHVRAYVTIDGVEFSSDTITFEAYRPVVDIKYNGASLTSQSIYKTDVIGDDTTPVTVSVTGVPADTGDEPLGTSTTDLVSLDNDAVKVNDFATAGNYSIEGSEATDAGVAVEGIYVLANYVYKDTVYINVILPSITILGSDFAIAGGNTKVLGYSLVRGTVTTPSEKYTDPVWEITAGSDVVSLSALNVANPTLTALKTGEATIEVSFEYGDILYKDDIVVSVPIYIDGDSTVAVDNTIDLDVDPIVAVTWTSSDTSVATVSQAGVVTGKDNGVVVITATGKVNGTTYSAVKTVTVGAGAQPKITISANQSAVNITVTKGSQSHVITAGSIAEVTLEEAGDWTFTTATANVTLINFASSGLEIIGSGSSGVVKNITGNVTVAFAKVSDYYWLNVTAPTSGYTEGNVGLLSENPLIAIKGGSQNIFLESLSDVQLMPGAEQTGLWKVSLNSATAVPITINGVAITAAQKGTSYSVEITANS